MKNNIVLVIVMTIFGIIVPIALMKVWQKKTGTVGKVFAAGLVCYLVFARILESIANSFCLNTGNPVGAYIVNSPIVYVLYICLSSGLIEEFGRWFGFKSLIPQANKPADSIGFGIGFSGAEQFFTIGIVYALYLLVMIGSGVEDASSNAAILEIANSITWGRAFLTILEKLDAYMLHIGLSMIVFCSVQGKGMKSLFPLAVLLHAFANLPAALFQLEILKSTAILELLLVAYTGCLLGIGILFMRKYEAQRKAEENTNPGVR